ncbi:hypothetical protein Mapa_011649 [Marchantia paleacea]|nr:hypothetical protein Mapa_011649 [Marchantia paleacea]
MTQVTPKVQGSRNVNKKQSSHKTSRHLQFRTQTWSKKNNKFQTVLTGRQRQAKRRVRMQGVMPTGPGTRKWFQARTNSETFQVTLRSSFPSARNNIMNRFESGRWHGDYNLWYCAGIYRPS